MIILERDGRWASVLRRIRPERVGRLIEVRSRPDCWQAHLQNRAESVVLEVRGPSWLEQLELIARLSDSLVRPSWIATVGDRSLNQSDLVWSLRQAGATYVLTSPREFVRWANLSSHEREMRKQ